MTTFSLRPGMFPLDLISTVLPFIARPRDASFRFGISVFVPLDSHSVLVTEVFIGLRNWAEETR